MSKVPTPSSGRGNHNVAVALKYEEGGTPVVTASGKGYVAQKIMDAAREHGVPIEDNPLLAQALSQVELDREIPVELYRAVAEVIAFIVHGIPKARQRF
jgi:flagellar biosynthesis protein